MGTVKGMNAFFQKYHRFFILVLFVLFLQAKNFQENKGQILARCLSFDYDGYWHLLRVQEIHRTGNWDNEINPRGNAPFGERIHWTRAMDLVLWSGAKVGSWFTDFETSLWWWGVFVGPAFYVLSLLTLVLFGRVLVGPKYVMHLALLFLCNLPQMYIVYSVNRPDHHCLVAFAYVLYYCLSIAFLERPPSARMAVATGLAGAFGLWCGLEMLTLVGLSVFYLAFLWLVQGRKYLKANGLLALALSVGLMITVLLDEKASHWWSAAYDKRSIVHVALFFFIGLFWLGALLFTRMGLNKTVRGRLVVAGAGCIGVLLPFLILFPEFTHGPMAKIDPRLNALYLSRTGEFGAMNGSCSPAEAVYYVLLVLPGFLYAIWAAYANRSQRRVVFSWLAITIGVYCVLMLAMGRWVFTLAFLSVLPTTFVLRALWDWRGARRHAVLAVAATFVLLCAPYGALTLQRSAATNRNRASKKQDTRLVTLLSFLESQAYTTPGQIVLANICVGPAIMYHTSLDAVGTPNHNNDMGIIDTHRIVNAEDDATAHELMAARGIAYLLVDESLKEFAAFRIDSVCESSKAPPEATFLGRLNLGHVPNWLVKMPLPDALTDIFTLYRVIDHGVKDR